MTSPPADVIRGWRRVALIGVKSVHTAAFFSIGSCLVYLAYSGLAKRSDRRAAIAGAVVTGETLIYAANGFRCPLTDVAERLGSEHGSVADIYLPRWIESHLPFITGPIFVGALALHLRNVLRSRRVVAEPRHWHRFDPREAPAVVSQSSTISSSKASTSPARNASNQPRYGLLAPLGVYHADPPCVVKTSPR